MTNSIWHPYQLFLLFIAEVGATLAFRAVSPVQESLRTALSISDNQMALLQGPVMILPLVLLAVPLGVAIDRYSRVRLLSMFMALAMAGSVLTAIASSFATLLAARALVGFASAVATLAVFSLIADLYTPAQRGRAKGIIVTGQSVGNAAAFAVGGALLAWFGSSDGWRWAMFWLTAPLLLAVMGLIFKMREPPRSGVVIQKPSLRDTFRELWSYRALVVPIMVGVALADVPPYALLTWAAPVLSRHFLLAPDRVGAIMGAAVIVSGVLGPLLGGALADMCQRAGGPRTTFLALICCAIVGMPAAFFALAPSLWWMSALLILCGMVSAATTAMAVTLFTIVVPNEIRGLGLSLLFATDAFALALAPVAVSVLSGAMPGDNALGSALTVVCIVASVLCAMTFFLGRRGLSRGNSARALQPAEVNMGAGN